MKVYFNFRVLGKASIQDNLFDIFQRFLRDLEQIHVDFHDIATGDYSPIKRMEQKMRELNERKQWN